MNREEFYEEVLKEMSHTVENAEVSLNRTTKNNGIVRTGITIRTTKSSISPVIYLDEMYTTYESNQNMEEIVTTVLDIYNKSIIENPVQVNPDMFRWEAAKENLFIKVVNYVANQKQLEGLVHEIFLDLAIIPCVQVDMKDEALGSVTVNKILADTWGISDEEIISAAKKNTPELFDVLMKPLFEMIKSLLSIDEKDELQDFQEPGIYVLTNKMNIHGAMFLGISEVLEEARRKLGVESFYILPSSIHECLIVTEKNMDPKELRKMVRDVNNSHVQPDEVLSYSIYKYDGTEVSIIESGVGEDYE